MSIFKKLFWNNDNKWDLLEKFERARGFKKAHFNCYLNVLKKIHEKEELLLEQEDK